MIQGTTNTFNLNGTSVYAGLANIVPRNNSVIDALFITKLLKVCDLCTDSKINVGDYDSYVNNKVLPLTNNQFGVVASERLVNLFV